MKKFMFVFGSFIILIAAVLLTLVLISTQEPSPAPQGSTQSVVPSIPEIEPVENPLEGEIPDTSPTQNTNPFSNTYINPFK